MLYKQRERLRRWWFNTRCKEILSTGPIQGKRNDLVILSMVSHRDLMMYLIAIKSLYSHLGEGQIVIVDDGTLTPMDTALLGAHLNGSLTVGIKDVQLGKCPRGGTWERLLKIADYVADSYVIQLDSDTLTLHGIPEVVEAIRKNCSFTLGTSMGRQIVPMKEMCEQIKKIDSDHVQVIAEQRFDRLANFNELKYVRGCSGFAGFAKGSFSRSKVESFSLGMERNLGRMWFNWGTEQVTSNFIVANSPDAFVLPYPRYANFMPDLAYQQSSFLHFIGTHRFRNGIYIRKAMEVARRLKEQQG